MLKQIAITVPAFVFTFSSPLAVARFAYSTTDSFVQSFARSCTPSYSPSSSRDETTAKHEVCREDIRIIRGGNLVDEKIVLKDNSIKKEVQNDEQ